MRFTLAIATLMISSVSGAETVPDFARDGRPFLEKHCLACHGSDKPEADFSLDSFRNSSALVKQRKVWDKVLKRIESGEMPPEKRPRPAAIEIESFTKHVRDVFDDADRRAQPDPGRVTMRRLNRNEYRNTIRDLVGVDFDPTEDFPSDDIGHGFDNIGEVLTLPPVLMERYLAAAEGIVSRAILPSPLPPPERHLSSRYTEPAADKVPMHGKFRVLSADGESPLATGPVNTPYEWADDGEYIFRTRVYGNVELASNDASAEPQTANAALRTLRVAVLVHGPNLPQPAADEDAAKLVGRVLRPFQILQTFEVKADKPDNAETLEVRLSPMPGRQRMAVALVKPNADQSHAKLFVEYLALKGPLDTRPASHRRLLACSADKPKAEQTREVLTRFLLRAYRRPATADEFQRLADLVNSAEAAGESWEAAVQLAIQAVLCSPKFLFRVELDDRPLIPETRPLDEFSLASRLSYFLWSTMPDDELLALAERRELTANLDAQVRRLLLDPKSQALVQNFARQWLQIQRLEIFAPDGKQFPQFNNKLRQAMMTETDRFFESVMREDRSILDLLDADYTFLNEPLARHYGIADTNGNWTGQKPERPGGQPIRGREFQRVSLQGRTRGGLITQASVLAVTSNPTRTSPVKRGRWVLEQILGEPPPPPPPNVPELPEDEAAVAGGSLRERLEIHRRNPSCANCHAKMDPIGFALENYDAVGAFRTKDGAFPIDTSGEFADGSTFQGPEDLKSVLKDKPQLFCRCLAEKLLIYALGRGLEYYDTRTVERIVQTVATGDYKFSALVTAIVHSDPFRLRRGSEE